MEFCDPTWYADDVLEMLERRGVSLCLHDCRAQRQTERRAGTDVYAYFNNDVGGYAPRDAVRLRRLMEDSDE